ncbi:MAG TPA: N-acetyltransferase [Acidobacteriaceae bacterium]|nr:N-acetyltransferase [Acidobacteriaceae bacterium]
MQPDRAALVVRPAVLADVAELAEIDAICFAAGIAYPASELAALLNSHAVLTIVAEASAKIAGFAAMGFLPSRKLPGNRCGELITIDVLPEFRRQHVGLQLHRALEEQLFLKNGDRLQLHVGVDNWGAIEFYRRLGYKRRERVPRYYLDTLDAWRMEKLL